MRQDRLPPNPKGIDPFHRWTLWARVWEDGKAKWKLIARCSKERCQQYEVDYKDTHEESTVIEPPDEMPIMRFGNHCHRDWRPENAE